MCTDVDAALLMQGEENRRSLIDRELFNSTPGSKGKYPLLGLNFYGFYEAAFVFLQFAVQMNFRIML